MFNPCPIPSSRDRNADLKRLAIAWVKDSDKNEPAFTSHVVETPDLLAGRVEEAIGVECRFDWSREDLDFEGIKAWHDWCCDLYFDVSAFILNAIEQAR